MAAADAGGTGRTGLGRVVVWSGIVFGTAFAILMLINGVTPPRIGGVPSWLGLVLGAVIAYVLIIGITITLAELTRRHHKDAGRYLARQGRRGGTAAARTARSRGQLVTGWARRRWQARQPAAARPRQPQGAPAAPLPTRRLDGKPETDADKRFFDLRESGYTGPVDQDGNPAGPPLDGGTTTMTDTTSSAAGQRSGTRARRRRAAAGDAGTAWKQLIADTADFEPEDDGHLLDWMAGEVTGMAAYAESLTDVYETAVNTVGLDPVAMAALHDTADAAAEAAEAMATARAKFAAHYGEVREFAASGGLLPYNGRWMTGDGDA